MTATSPPAYVQGGTFSASLDRIHQNTAAAIPASGLTFAAREGCFAGRMPAFSNPSGWQVVVGPCAGYVTNDSAVSVGDYTWANPSNATVTLTASSPTLNRIDLVGLQVKDNFLDSSGLNSATVVIVQGTAVSGTASPPALPNSFIPLVQASVPAASVNPTLTSIAVRTGQAGQVLPVANATERTAIAAQPYDGMAIWRIDRQWIEVYSVAQGGWLVQGIGVTSSAADATATITTPFVGQKIYRSDVRDFRVWDGGVWRHERIIGGVRVIAAGIITSSGATNTEINVPRMAMSGRRVVSGTVYILHMTMAGQSSVNGDDYQIRVREDSTAGNTIFDKRWIDGSAPVVNDQRDWFTYWKCTATNTNKSFFVSVTRLLGTGQLDIQGDSKTAWWIEEHTADTSVWTDVA
jgi:hypothetical protein